MAASDKPYRNQITLDMVFAISSLLMLLSTIWMFADDYYRPYKPEQRAFREVEVAVAQRMALDQLPEEKDFDKAEAAVKSALEARAQKDSTVRDLKAELATDQPKRESAEARFQTIKADVESISSLYNIAVEQKDTDKINNYRERLTQLNSDLSAAQATRDEIIARMKTKQVEIDNIEKPVTDAQSALKKVVDRFDTQVKVAVAKRWGWGDTIRNLPIIDAFAAPTKIHQITNNDLPIDYNFKQVTRFDRCQTCHLGIERPTYTKDMLRSLTQVTDDQKKKLKTAREYLKKRQDVLAGTPEGRTVPSPDDLDVTPVSDRLLTDARVNEYCAHPRLELFVGAKSKHPAEKFGCSSCHAGQGSATDFTLASHTPNSSLKQGDWKKEHGWTAIHDWEFPMLPQRFIESSCVKCHHQVTDLISSDNRVEAPKLLRGYNLIKENGCFGCHEIQGTKGGRAVGPDIRLENYPPLEDLTPIERVKIESDPENRPGNMRKVGPSLFRVAEKTNTEWTQQWLRSPRSFRPDTKMPHFYGVTNNDKDALAGTGMEKFPDAEIQSVTHYLFTASNGYVAKIAELHKTDTPDARAKDEALITALLVKGKEKLSDAEKTELNDLRFRMKLRHEKQLDPKELAPQHKGDVVNGRILFTERGCLACHQHQGTETNVGSSADTKTYSPSIKSEAQFGPNLSQLAAKLGSKKGDPQSARNWLVQWIMDPHVHSPRSRMPVTHLSAEQAADVAAWLLSQEPKDLGHDWYLSKDLDDKAREEVTVQPADQKTLKALAKVYLVRLLSKSDMNEFVDSGKIAADVAKDLPVDEQALAKNYTAAQDDTGKENALKFYLGKKAVGRLGCYACHDVPGFENAKTIGVGLNDWGKKDANRLAFEDIANYMKTHYRPVDRTVDENGKPQKPEVKDGVKMKPYEKVFFDDLTHHGHQGRIGYLNQKILEPRSYDYKRLRAWDDLSRMPEFRFARSHRHKDETEDDFQARTWKDEADAREAVMTFVLGLTAEQVPEKMINMPKGDRLAEVKGRQVIDKYNCAGCHLIRPSAIDFKKDDPAMLSNLQRAFENAKNATEQNGYHTFPNHNYWTGKNPTSDRLVANGTRPKLAKDDPDADDEPFTRVEFRLMEALRYYPGADGTARDIPSFTQLEIPLKDLARDLGMDEKQLQSQAALDSALAAKNVLGGTFSDLLTPYLARKNKELFALSQGDSGQARASLPPSLVGQGERTQPGWLNRFLLDPQPVRRMSILRMPKFNMSPQEADALVQYFIGVERITNPGIGLAENEALPQHGDLTDPYWQQKTKDYVARLKAMPAVDKKGNPIKGKTEYDIRQESYQDTFKQLATVTKASAKDEVDKVKAALDGRNKEMKELTKKADDEKNADEKAKLKKQADELKTGIDSDTKTLKELETAAGEITPAAVKASFEKTDALTADAYRLLVNRMMCLQCHDVGGYRASNQVTQGPPLALAHERLRPGWLYRWIATPQRHIPYVSVMPVNFPHKEDAQGKVQLLPDFQGVVAGTPRQEIEALRDILMNYPRVTAAPVNRQWNPAVTQATGDTKK